MLPFAPFRRLQWRLTFSYTLVTVAALLIVELLVLFGLYFLTRSNLVINAVGEALYELYVPEAEQFLRAVPSDLEGLNRWATQMFGSNGVIAAAETSFGTAGNGGQKGNDWQVSLHGGRPVYILDANGFIIEQQPRPSQFIPGHQPLNFDSFPRLAELFTAVQQGERELSQLRATLPGGLLVYLLPIVDANDRLLGVFIITVPLPGLNNATLRPLLIIIVASLIPFTLMAGLIGTFFGFLTARNLTRRIGTVALAADHWRRGNFSMVAHDNSPDELGQLSHHLNQMAEQLQTLLQTRQELAALEERNRLARELHDAVKQQIFATTMQIGAAQTMLANDPAAAADRLREAETLARQAQQELTTLIQQLRPATWPEQGLAKMVRQHTADWSRQNNIPIEITLHGERPLPLPLEQTLFRIIQEALANVARHSQASQVYLHLVWDAAHVTLTIQDNGRGFNPQVATHGFGLQGMRERLDKVGGQLQITSQPGEGTTLKAEL